MILYVHLKLLPCQLVPDLLSDDRTLYPNHNRKPYEQPHPGHFGMQYSYQFMISQATQRNKTLGVELDVAEIPWCIFVWCANPAVLVEVTRESTSSFAYISLLTLLGKSFPLKPTWSFHRKTHPQCHFLIFHIYDVCFWPSRCCAFWRAAKAASKA